MYETVFKAQEAYLVLPPLLLILFWLLLLTWLVPFPILFVSNLKWILPHQRIPGKEEVFSFSKYNAGYIVDPDIGEIFAVTFKD